MQEYLMANNILITIKQMVKHLWNAILVTDFNNIFYKNSFKYYEQINYFFLFPITNFSYCTK